MNLNAQELGRMAKGKPKLFTAIELERRRIRLADARVKRWAGKTDKQTKESSI